MMNATLLVFNFVSLFDHFCFYLLVQCLNGSVAGHVGADR